MLLKRRWTQTGLVGELLLLLVGLGAMAIPSYSYIDYQDRAKVSEGLTLASLLKGAMVDYYVHYDSLPQGSTEEIHQKMSLAEPHSISGRYVEAVMVDSQGRIRAQFRPETFKDSAIVLEMTPNKDAGFFTWTCKGDSEDARFLRALPAECRN